MLLEGGEYDVFRRDALRIELDRIEPRTAIVLDLATTDYIDRSCIGVLIARLRSRRAFDAGRNLRLVDVRPNLATILRLLKLDEPFTIDDLR
jgi:anti-anti-sigma regulatory factor